MTCMFCAGIDETSCVLDNCNDKKQHVLLQAKNGACNDSNQSCNDSIQELSNSP